MLQQLVTVSLPDLIICDYRLRAGENGIEVVEMLRNEFNVDIPAVLVTAIRRGRLRMRRPVACRY